MPRPSEPRILLGAALLPVLASVLTLALGEVGVGVWRNHLMALGLAVLLAASGKLWARRGSGTPLTLSLFLLTGIGLAAPLLGGSAGPERWVSLGPLNLYMAPVVLPSFLAAFSSAVRQGGRQWVWAAAALVATGLLLALQPDASQLLALLVGTAVVVARAGSKHRGAALLGLALGGLAVATAWAFGQPDTLRPVPHVEGVFRLALDHSLLAGVAVISSAVALVAILGWGSTDGKVGLSAVAAYYAVLFGGSVAGLTPAPLIGYGAGPLLGYGLWVALSHTRPVLNSPPKSARMPTMPTNSPQLCPQGLVVFAKDKSRVSAFYQQTLALEIEESAPSHDLLRGHGMEIVIHAIPERYAAEIRIAQPPEPREETPLKPTFLVPSLAAIRAAAKATGGFLKPAEATWHFRGCAVLDGWDPEGNIVQFQEPTG